jgi:serine/threonine protein kinase
VLVSDRGVAKLADFGCSKQLQGVRTNSLEESLKAIRGSIPWMAPEVIKQTGHGRKADIWSVGATVVEMATATHPWPAFSNNLAALFNIATAKEPPPLPASMSAPGREFLAHCFQLAPEERATASELLAVPFLTEAPHPHPQPQPQQEQRQQCERQEQQPQQRHTPAPPPRESQRLLGADI